MRVTKSREYYSWAKEANTGVARFDKEKKWDNLRAEEQGPNFRWRKSAIARKSQ